MGRTGQLRLLLDTHTFLWADTQDPRLSAVAREALEDTSNQIVLSVVSVLELAIKSANGRLDLGEPVHTYLQRRLTAHSLEVLPVEFPHAVRVASLPGQHGDPFDRLLAAQSLVEELPMLTTDPVIAAYGVEVIW
jgi:PIN domain nuclease of toxin-antitoxin system